ncbi:MAG: hypothetical protein VB137_11315 [Burkholderia sp.]
MLKKVAVQEVALAATEGARRRRQRRRIQALVRRAQTRCRSALAARRID